MRSMEESVECNDLLWTKKKKKKTLGLMHSTSLSSLNPVYVQQKKRFLSGQKGRAWVQMQRWPLLHVIPHPFPLPMVLETTENKKINVAKEKAKQKNTLYCLFWIELDSFSKLDFTHFSWPLATEQMACSRALIPRLAGWKYWLIVNQ